MLQEQDIDDKHEQLDDERLRERREAFRKHVAAKALAPYTPIEDRSPQENLTILQFLSRSLENKYVTTNVQLRQKAPSV